jgi:hypothetical protein
MSEEPCGTSIRNMEHWAQGILNNSFQMMDWGNADSNQAKYGTEIPPLYDLTRVGVPTALYSGPLSVTDC